MPCQRQVCVGDAIFDNLGRDLWLTYRLPVHADFRGWSWVGAYAKNLVIRNVVEKNVI